MIKCCQLKNNRIYEDFFFNHKLNYLTKFNIINNCSQKNIIKITLNFGFKNINFDKKKMILFFMVLELITNQKCVLTSSRKNVEVLRIKRGSITGCKVTLRKINLFEFLDNLIISLPRSENFKGFFFNKKTNKQNNFSTNIEDLFIFYPLESEIVSYIKTLNINFSLNTTNDFEKFFIFSSYKLPLIIK
jgi:large subunit ribosomal protein L5